mmetsp:Transcript_12250/g.26689  ORF Transcript_12250/g.26689 Transcript_12250/m.26689 type:complete len:224 (+) Transcript_12250:95-766(+)
MKSASCPRITSRSCGTSFALGGGTPQKRKALWVCSTVRSVSSWSSFVSFSMTRFIYLSRLWGFPRTFTTSSMNLQPASSSESEPPSHSSRLSSWASSSSSSSPPESDASGDLSARSFRSDPVESLRPLLPVYSWMCWVNSVFTTCRSRAKARIVDCRAATCILAIFTAGCSSLLSCSAGSRSGCVLSIEATRKCSEDMRPVLKSRSVSSEPTLMALAPFLLSP